MEDMTQSEQINNSHNAILTILSKMGIDLAVGTNEIQNIKTRISDTQVDVKETKADVKDLNVKVGFQNGRVSKLEQWSNEAIKIIEATNKLAVDTSVAYAKDQAKVWTAFKVISILFPTILALGVMVAMFQMQKIAKEVVSQAYFNKGDVESITKDNQ